MISKDLKIIDVLNNYPQAVSVLQKNGVGCLGCLMAHSESIGEGLAAHGLDADTILAEIEAASVTTVNS